MSRELLDELADLVADRLERRRPAAVHAHEDLNPATIGPKWTDRLANTLHDIRLRRLASGQSEDVVGDQPER